MVKLERLYFATSCCSINLYIVGGTQKVVTLYCSKTSRISLNENSKAISDDKLVKDFKKIEMKPIEGKFKFCQVDNEENCFDFNYDLITTKIDQFKNESFQFFKKTFEEFNCHLGSFEFYKVISSKDLSPIFSLTNPRILSK